MREMRSGPNSGNAASSSRRSDEPSDSSTPAPARLITYRFRANCAISRTNEATSEPVSTNSSTKRKHAPASWAPTACMSRATPSESEPPSMRSAASSVMFPPQNTMSCSSDVRALRIPPSARCAMRSSASGSHSTPSETQMAPSRETIASAAMRWKSNRWQREWMVSGTFCGSVVARMKTTWAGGSSSVFSSALNAGTDSMWTSSMMYIL